MICKKDEELAKEKQTCTTNEKQKLIKKLKYEYEEALKIKEEAQWCKNKMTTKEQKNATKNGIQANKHQKKT